MLKSGYYSVPPGVYFNGPFTTSVWVNAKSKGWSVRVFDFSVNGPFSDNIIFGLFKDATSASYFQILSGFNILTTLSSNKNIFLNEWIHLAVTFDGSQTNFYYNGMFAGSTLQSQPSNLVRNTNFIGMSNFGSDDLADAVYDELRIYNRVLDSNEINILMFY